MSIVATNNIIRSRAFQAYSYLYNPKLTPPRQSWVESFDSLDRKRVALAELHPSVFGVFPRPDFVSSIIQWQKIYRRINWISMPTRNELPGGTRRPWPQKGTGRARHKSTNSPLWIKGGWARGPRGPQTWFYKPPFFNIVNGLRSMMTIKLAQDDLKIIDSLEGYNSRDPQFLMDMVESRNWGPSALIVDKGDTFGQDITLAAESVRHINLLPVYGLNPLMMARHETLIMTVAAIQELEEKLLHQLVRVDLNEVVTSRRISGN